MNTVKMCRIVMQSRAARHQHFVLYNSVQFNTDGKGVMNTVSDLVIIVLYKAFASVTGFGHESVR